MDLAQRHARITQSVVEICVTEHKWVRSKRSKLFRLKRYYKFRDGIIVTVKPRYTRIIADDRALRGPIRKSIEVSFGDQVTLPVANIVTSGNGIAVLICHHEHPVDGFREIEFFGGAVREMDEVYTYSSRNDDEVLTPGTITSIGAKTFNHTCPAHYRSEFGSAVTNGNAQLVGICSSYHEHLTARNIVSIATKIEHTLQRPFVVRRDVTVVLRVMLKMSREWNIICKVSRWRT
ncbi:hypothetical protein EJB05_43601 [Eragrostis curvula]|uniref:Uncharacterized protein n=1 Tax=Eragrostis curvula TaxID=38414 RepID=A0A5J9TF96_9POAL|nr:hypothetical protein EJB05_43601 [Eragrostis curvula]